MSIADPPSDREQSDADNAAAVASRDAASRQQSADHEITVGRLDTLTEAIKEQSRSNTQLAIATVEYQERARTAARRFRTTMIVLGVVVVTVLGGIALVISRLNDNLVNGAAARNLIVDCVQPSGECFRESETRTASVVGQLVAALDADGVVRAACAQAEASNVTASVDKRIADMTACIAAHRN